MEERGKEERRGGGGEPQVEFLKLTYVSYGHMKRMRLKRQSDEEH